MKGIKIEPGQVWFLKRAGMISNGMNLITKTLQEQLVMAYRMGNTYKVEQIQRLKKEVRKVKQGRQKELME